MKTFQTIEAAANLKGIANHTYNRLMSAMAEDTTAADIEQVRRNYANYIVDCANINLRQ